MIAADVLVPVLIPYARFLEVRARRLDIAGELAQPEGLRPTGFTDSSESLDTDERARVAVRLRATHPAAVNQEG